MAYSEDSGQWHIVRTVDSSLQCGQWTVAYIVDGGHSLIVKTLDSGLQRNSRQWPKVQTVDSGL